MWALQAAVYPRTPSNYLEKWKESLCVITVCFISTIFYCLKSFSFRYARHTEQTCQQAGSQILFRPMRRRWYSGPQLELCNNVL
jgi:hypothetical protein